MTVTQITYLTFCLVLVAGVLIDLGFLSKKSVSITIHRALLQTLFWVGLAMAYFAFLWYEDGHKIALEYFSAYLMEWSLSIDNIFVFILIFTFFGVREEYYGRVLLIGILLAIILRILFISAGIVLIAKFDWLLYVFGAILVYTGITMFLSGKDEGEMDLDKNRVYRLLKRFMPLTAEDAGGRFTITREGKRYFTRLTVVIILLATTDIVFAVDSIPAVFGITRNNEVIYTSNIFAVLGLRSLFFLLKGAVNRFHYLQQGIAVVLIFIGVKMLIEFFNIHVNVFISLAVILVCISGAMLFSILSTRREARKKT